MTCLLAPNGDFSILRYVLLLSATVVLYPFLIALYNISPLHPLHSYPGPLLWRAFRLSWIISVHSGYFHTHVRSFHDRYGPVVRIAPNELSYANPQAWRDLYVSAKQTSNDDFSHGGVIKRNPTWFRKMKPSDPDTIFGPNEAAHARYRRAFMGAFTDKALRDYSHVLDDNVDLLIRKFRDKATHAESVDLVSWFNFLTFDVSGTLSFGESFGSIEAGRAHPWVAISYAFGKGLIMICSLKFLGLTKRPFGGLLQFIIPKAARERMLYHRQLTEEKVEAYVNSEDEHKQRAPFIDAAVRYSQDPKHLDEALNKPELSANMSFLIFAGSETISSALSSIISYLLQNKHCLQNLTHEIRTTFADEKDITVSSAAKLEYMTACINEGMRMGPPVVIGVPRVIPPGGSYICNKLVPAGTYVGLNQYPTYRSSTNFSSPNTFNPERFLPAHQHEYNDNTDTFQPFGLGRHQCIGQRLAWAEMRLVLARLLYAFDVQLAHGQEQKDFVKQKTFIFWEKEALMVRLKER